MTTKWINAVVINPLHPLHREPRPGEEHKYYGTFESLEAFRQALIDDPEIIGFSDGESYTDQFSVIEITTKDRQEHKIAWRWVEKAAK